VGVWDKRVSEQIHGYIHQILNQMTDDEKSLANLTGDEAQSATGEGIQPIITEENLDDSSSQEGGLAEFDAYPGGQTQAQTPTKFAKMTADSVFIIFFKQNSNELSEKAVQKLDQVFEILRNNSYAKVSLNGYSDSLGPAAYNQMISEIRANAVKSYLIGKGIAPSRIQAFGYGAQKFIASNKSAEGRQLNRRVEIELVNP